MALILHAPSLLQPPKLGACVRLGCETLEILLASGCMLVVVPTRDVPKHTQGLRMDAEDGLPEMITVTMGDLIARQEALLSQFPHVLDFEPADCCPESIYCGNHQDFSPRELRAIEELFAIAFLMGD
jgi:hypothetical protein